MYSLRLVAISEGVVKSWSELLLDMEMLGSSERSDPLVHMVFDARVYFFTMVVGLVLPPRHCGFQMFLNQLNGSSSVFG